MIEIKNMRPSTFGRAQAQFDVAIDEWLIRDCVILRPRDDALSALPPILRSGERSVDIPERYWFEFIEKSLNAYRDWVAWGRPGSEAPEDAEAGVRRIIGDAERKTLEMGWNIRSAEFCRGVSGGAL